MPGVRQRNYIDDIKRHLIVVKQNIAGVGYLLEQHMTCTQIVQSNAYYVQDNGAHGGYKNYVEKFVVSAVRQMAQLGGNIKKQYYNKRAIIKIYNFIHKHPFPKNLLLYSLINSLAFQ
jgi:hypothetical protein